MDHRKKEIHASPATPPPHQCVQKLCACAPMLKEQIVLILLHELDSLGSQPQPQQTDHLLCRLAGRQLGGRGRATGSQCQHSQLPAAARCCCSSRHPHVNQGVQVSCTYACTAAAPV